MALKNKSFELWYIDAFAGSGERTAKRESGGLFEGKPVETTRVQLDGSAKRALAIDPPFQRLVFIEQDAKRFAALQKLRLNFSSRRIETLSADANDALLGIFSQAPWSSQSNGRGIHRAVVFLDPYDMSVKWRTLEVLAHTGAVDVWYLFPLNAVVRQLANDFSAVDSSKQASLDEIFGTADWRSELYREPAQEDLFGETAGPRRIASQAQIEAYARRRLLSLFPSVSKPLPLLTPRGSQLFSIFCISANKSGPAQALVAKGVAHILKKYG